MKLVVFPAVDSERLGRIVSVAGTMQVVNATTLEEAAREIIDADAFFGKMTRELLALAQKLRWVQAPTASLEHYMFPELVAHPCTLSNMRGLFSDVIADHVLGCVVMFARNFHLYLRQQIGRVWEPIGGEAGRSDFISGPGVASAIDRSHRHLADCTLGIVGVGEIGREIARRGLAFGMRVCGVDPVCREVPGVIADVWPTEKLDDLLAASDFVVIAAPHTPRTHKLFRREQFERMRAGAVLINIGRGAIVDLADLTAVLIEKRIAGAALDVFETEPLPADHPLWGMANVFITPHIAGTSPRIAERHTATLLENVRRFVEGQVPATVVDKACWF